MKKAVSVILVLILVMSFAPMASADYGILVTRHPSDATCMEGGATWFVSDAQYYSNLDWTFVDPCGTEYSAPEFLSIFPYLTIEGEYTTTLTVGNLSPELNGWAVFCNFHSAVDNARTNWGFFHVDEYATPNYVAPDNISPFYNYAMY